MKKKSRYSDLFALLNRHGLEYKEILADYSNKESLRDLTDKELEELTNCVIKTYGNKVPPGDPQRKKFISLARQMRWGNTTKEILQAIDNWLLKQKYRKPLMGLLLPELNLMLAVFEQKVFAEYLESFYKKDENELQPAKQTP